MSVSRGIFIGTVIVGLLDGLDALVFFGLRGSSPARIFQGISYGMLGPAALTGGAATALLGLFFHFVVAFGIVSTFVGLSRRFPQLTRSPFIYGPIYGIAVYAFMNLVVIPLSAIGAPSFSPLRLANGLFAHIVLVGTPTALVARRIVPVTRAALRNGIRA